MRSDTLTVVMGGCVTALLAIILLLATLNTNRLWDISERVLILELKCAALNSSA